MSENTFFGYDTGSGDKTVASIFRSGEVSLVEPPEWAGNIVAMTVYNGSVMVACQRAVFRLQGNTLVPLLFEDDPS